MPTQSRGHGTHGARLVLTAFIAALSLGMVRTAAADEKKDARIRMALVPSLLRDSTAAVARPMVAAFGAMVQAQTGLEAEVLRGDEPLVLARKIRDNEIQLGIFQGVEYAWAKEKYPELKPLMVIINQHPKRHGVLVVRGDDKITGFGDLKGKTVAMPMYSRCHCELFLQRGTGGAEAKKYFADLVRLENSEDALDDLVDGRCEGVVLDIVALESYQRRKPARAARLNVATKSEPFPPSVVAYRPGKVDNKRLKQFQDGMLRSNETTLGRQLLLLWRMSAFQAVPADLDTQLDEILKFYPAPVELEKKGK
jgi:ABC-type phosphate/phosphonate transport system substrate-binding protein